MSAKSIVLVAFVLLLSIPTLGGPSRLCVTGTLESYILLGSSGCQEGNVVFANFSYASSVGAPNPNQITVSPLSSSASGAQLTFSANWSAVAQTTEASDIMYTAAPALAVSPAASGELGLLLGPATVYGIFGSVDIKEKASNSVEVATLEVYEKCTEVCSIKKSDQVSFSPVQKAFISDDVTITGGSNGAKLSSFTATFTLCPLCV